MVRRVPRIASLPARVVVLVSGTGSNLAALLQAAADPAYGVSVPLVGSDVPGAPALERARAAGVPTVVVPLHDHPRRADWDVALTQAVAAARPDLVVCAGFMRLLGPAFLARFDGRIVNTHPALLPAFPGAHAVADALAYGVRVTGATVHLVDAGVDTGPVLAQECVPVSPDDDEASLHDRIKTVEHALLVDVVGRLVRDGWTVDGRKVTMP
jgi:phosphoribosylglycinamide formyltransferase-1